MTEEQYLRKWCLERAFEHRKVSGIAHMNVENVADGYFQFIMKGESQSNYFREYLAPSKMMGPEISH